MHEPPCHMKPKLEQEQTEVTEDVFPNLSVFSSQLHETAQCSARPADQFPRDENHRRHQPADPARSRPMKPKLQQEGAERAEVFSLCPLLTPVQIRLSHETNSQRTVLARSRPMKPKLQQETAERAEVIFSVCSAICCFHELKVTDGISRVMLPGANK